MPPKRNKSAAGSAGPGGHKWESGLTTAIFSDNDWRAAVVFLQPSSFLDQKSINFLLEVVNGGPRKLFHFVTQAELYKYANELGNPKQKKDKSVAQFYEINELVKSYVDQNEPVPVQIIAKLLKWRLLSIKQTDVKRREEEKKPVLTDAKAKAGKGGKKDRGKSATGKAKPDKGGKQTDVPPAPKKETKLKKRGEEDADNRYIDDEPEDGPDCYILLTGFNDALILQALCDIGVNVDCVIRVESDDYEIYAIHKRLKEQFDDTVNKEDNEEEVLAREIFEKELVKFWHDVPLILRQAPLSCKLQDCVQLTHIIDTSKMPERMDVDIEVKNEYTENFYESIACLIYDLFDWHRQYQHYLSNTKIISVPTPSIAHHAADAVSVQIPATPKKEAVPTTPKTDIMPAEEVESSIEHEVDLRYYNDLLSVIPSESISVSIILHCLLEQISSTECGSQPPSERKEVSSDVLDPGLAQHLANIVCKLSLTEEERQSLEKQFEHTSEDLKLGDNQSTEIFACHDLLSLRLRHLQPMYGFNPINAEKNMVRYTPSAALLNFSKAKFVDEREKSSWIQELLYHCSKKDLQQPDVDHAFKQFIFECMKLKATDANGDIKNFQENDCLVPWDDPTPFVKQTPSTPPEENKEANPVNPSRPSTGILKAPRENSASSSKGSVKFATPDQSHVESEVNISHVSSEDVRESFETNKSSDKPAPVNESNALFNSKLCELEQDQKRNLDAYSYTEHFEPHVLLQVLEDARYMLPFIDTYFCKKDNSLLVVFHIPRNDSFFCKTEWKTFLHSDVGFRNYFLHVQSKIKEWRDKEEDLYLKARSETEKALHLSMASIEKKDDDNLSHRESEDESADGKAFLRPNSLKEWKLEQIKLKEAEEKKKLEKDAVKSKTGKGSAKDKKGKRSASREGSRSRSGSRQGSRDNSSERKGKKHKQPAVEPLKDEETAVNLAALAQPEPQLPFCGYNLGNEIVHCDGKESFLFPCDGSQIRVKKSSFLDGKDRIQISLLNEGNILSTFLEDPVQLNRSSDNSSESEAFHTKVRFQQPPKPQTVSSFGSFSAVLSDGMSISLSSHGATGVNASAPPKYERVVLKPAVPPTPPAQPEPTKPSSGKGKKGKEVKSAAKNSNPPPITNPTPTASTPIPESPKEDDASVRNLDNLSNTETQRLYVSTPDGLTVKFIPHMPSPVLEGSQESVYVPPSLSVMQTYIMKSRGVQACEAKKKNPAWSEKYRLITTDGSVIKEMEDGSIQVLYANGAIASFSGPWVEPNDKHAPPAGAVSQQSERSGNVTNASRPNTSGKDSGRKAKSPTRSKPSPREQLDEEKREFVPEPQSCVQWTYTSDVGQRYATQKDGSLTMQDHLLYYTATDQQTGEVLLSRQDKVIIIRRPGDEAIIVDHSDGTRITTDYKYDKNDTTESNRMRFVTIECSGYATVQFTSADSSCTTFFGTGSRVFAHPSGVYVASAFSGPELAIDSKGNVAYITEPTAEFINGLCEIQPFDDLPDEYFKNGMYLMTHNSENVFKHVDANGTKFEISSSSIETITMQEERQFPTMELQRFFNINDNGTGEELLCHDDVIRYIQSAEVNPATAVIVDPIPENPDVKNITVMKPCDSNVSEQWMVPKIEEAIMPQSLTSRDLKSFPPVEIKKPGPSFGSNCGKGLYVGRLEKPQPPMIITVPPAVEKRQFLSYDPIKQNVRDDLSNALVKFSYSIESRNNFSENIQKVDPRSKSEIERAEHLREKMRSFSYDIENPFKSDEILLDRYKEEIKPRPPTPPIKAKPKRKLEEWERDRQEVLKEQENKRKLRMKEIPCYFDSYLAEEFLKTVKNKEKSFELEELSELLPVNAAKKIDSSRVLEDKAKVVKSPDQPKESADNTEQLENLPSNVNAEEVEMSKELSFEVETQEGVEEHLNEAKYQPNLKFLEIEEPVRRKHHTAATSGANFRVGSLRGFMVRPSQLHLGTLKEGCSYSSSFLLKNIGMDPCRFKVQQPAPATGVTVSYKPGQVAAGVSSKVDLTINALASDADDEGVGHLYLEIIIITEVEMIRLPLLAIVLTEDHYVREYGKDICAHSNSKLLSTHISSEPIRAKKVITS